MTNGVVEKPIIGIVKKEETQTCVHHWIIESPDGPVSKGLCQKCGEEKEFQNYFPYSKWESEQRDKKRADLLLKELGL